MQASFLLVLGVAPLALGRAPSDRFDGERLLGRRLHVCSFLRGVVWAKGAGVGASVPGTRLEFLSMHSPDCRWTVMMRAAALAALCTGSPGDNTLRLVGDRRFTSATVVMSALLSLRGGSVGGTGRHSAEGLTFDQGMARHSFSLNISARSAGADSSSPNVTMVGGRDAVCRVRCSC